MISSLRFQSLIHFECVFLYYTASLVAQMVKHLPAMWETRVRSLGQEDPLEKEMAAHSSPLAWRIPRTDEPGGLPSTGSQRVGQDGAASLPFLSYVSCKRVFSFCFCFLKCSAPGFQAPLFEDCLFSIVYSWLRCCHELIENECVSLFLGSLFCSTDTCACFCGRTILFSLL